MVYKRIRIKELVSDLTKGLRKRGISVEMVYLFGSYAWGHPTPASDIDLAIISPQFKKWDDIKRIEVLSDVARYISPNLDVDIDVVGFTNEELKESSYFDLAAEVRQKGRIIYKKAA